MADDFQEKSDAFLQWLSSLPSAVVSRKIGLHDFREHGRGRGVVAEEDIEEEEDLFTVPRSSIISVENAELPSILRPIIEELDPWISLIIVLIREYLKGDQSFWKPYFDILPTDFNTLIFWSPDQLAELQNSAVLSKIGKESADKKFKEELLPVIQQHADVFYPPGTNQLSSEALLALGHRFGSTIMAYAFDVEKDESQLQPDEDGWASDEEEEALPKGMVPLADMLNADVTFNALLYYGEQTLTMKAARKISKGEEVLNSYGELPRSDLLRRYGYITPSYAAFDVVEVPMRAIVDGVQAHQKLDRPELENRLEFLEDEGILDDEYDLTRLENGGSYFPEDLKTLVKVLLVQKQDIKKLKDLDDGRQSALRNAFGVIMKSVLEKQMKQYSTTIAEDCKLLDDPSTKGRREMAIRVRVGEKKLLAEAIDEVSRYFNDESARDSPTDDGHSSNKRRKI